MSDAQPPDATPMSDAELEALRNSDSRIVQLLVRYASGEKLSETEGNDEMMEVITWRSGTETQPPAPRFNHEDLAAITSEPSIALSRSLAQEKHFDPNTVPDLTAEPTPCWVDGKNATQYLRSGQVGSDIFPSLTQINTVYAVYDRTQKLRGAIEVVPSHDPGGLGDRWCLVWGTPDMGEFVVIVNPGTKTAWFAKLHPGEHTPKELNPEKEHHGLFHRH